MLQNRKRRETSNFYESNITIKLVPNKDPTKNYRPISLRHIDANFLNKILKLNLSTHQKDQAL